MSISVSKIINLTQTLQETVQENIEDLPHIEYKTLGGILSNKKYAWLSNGPRLEVISTKTGNIIGSWTFGWTLKDFECQVEFIDEIQRHQHRPPFLAVAIDTAFNSGVICIFDFLSSTVIRAIRIKKKITSLHVIDAGYDGFNLPGPLRTFDGIIAIGVAGGDVYLIDICRQICEEALTISGVAEIRDESNLCELNIITCRDIGKIELYKDNAIKNNQHLSIHLNVVFDNPTSHFVLKGPKGDDRIHVNKEEVAISALYYCPQLGSILIGFNFGALQLYNLISFDLIYTSPVCDEHIPVTHFAFQEPSDDPKAFCYIWATYSAGEYRSCLPLAVMYVFCYDTKEYHEGYGYLYENFNTASIYYQMELGIPISSHSARKWRKAYCLSLNSNHNDLIKKRLRNDGNEESVPLCVMAWTVEFNNKQSESYIGIFDLNLWYKEYMPKTPIVGYEQAYMLQMCLTEAIATPSSKKSGILDILFDTTSFRQFIAPQKLEEHFNPSSISFDLFCLRENDMIALHKTGVQKALLYQIKSSGPLCLVEPAKIYSEIIDLGLLPIFVDINPNIPVSTYQQREVILGTALENDLIHWLCKCAADWANGSCLAAGCSLDLIISWGFQRAVTLKNQSFNFCVPLFDYSGVKLDNNTTILLSNAMRQLGNICQIFDYILKNLSDFIPNFDEILSQYRSLQQVSVYFKVLQWFYQIGLLPEFQNANQPQRDELERISVPYPLELLNNFYTHARDILSKIAAAESTKIPTNSFLYIDNLIEKVFGKSRLEEQWKTEETNGLYPPPSIQSLLKSYLIDGVDYAQVHYLIVYFCFDLTTALDQNIYQSATTYLNKFPDSFGLNMSVLKIIQAFWHLDHDNAEIAIDFILHAMVNSKDLENWHHKVFLRSLLLQKQHQFALRYIQVLKPPLSDDEDILNTITVLISNNMLSDALDFRKRFEMNSNSENYLIHLFNQCVKYHQLKSLIYFKFNEKDEELFLDYLSKKTDVDSANLLVSYHILRTQYLEAFDCHEHFVPNKIKEQGLVGQQNALPVDRIVYSVKKTLPKTYKTLLETYNRERGNICKNMQSEKPMSTFFHDPNEKELYKSNFFVAALAKAKETFSSKHTNFLKSEETPFLCAPKIYPNRTKPSHLVIYPQIKDKLVSRAEDLDTPPCKKMKMSPKQSTLNIFATTPSILVTPTVKRRQEISTSAITTTPHSILKVKSISEEQRLPELPEEEKLDELSTPFQKTPGFGLTPRKPLTRTTPAVRFENLFNSSSSSQDATKSTNNSLTNLSQSIKQTSTDDEVFYSPETSIDESEKKLENDVCKGKTLKIEIPKLDLSNVVLSPKSRRGIKRSANETTPAVRSSPRLRKTPSNSESVVASPQKDNLKIEENELVSGSTVENGKNQSPDATNSPRLIPKLKPRKSLCRKVLETNVFRDVLKADAESPRRNSPRSKVTKTTEIVTEINVRSSASYTDGEEIHSRSIIEKQSITETDEISKSFNTTSTTTTPNTSLSSFNEESPFLKNVPYTSLELSQESLQNKEEISSESGIEPSLSIQLESTPNKLPEKTLLDSSTTENVSEIISEKSLRNESLSVNTSTDTSLSFGNEESSFLKNVPYTSLELSRRSVQISEKSLQKEKSSDQSVQILDSDSDKCESPEKCIKIKTNNQTFNKKEETEKNSSKENIIQANYEEDVEAMDVDIIQNEETPTDQDETALVYEDLSNSAVPFENTNLLDVGFYPEENSASDNSQNMDEKSDSDGNQDLGEEEEEQGQKDVVYNEIIEIISSSDERSQSESEGSASYSSDFSGTNEEHHIETVYEKDSDSEATYSSSKSYSNDEDEEERLSENAEDEKVCESNTVNTSLESNSENNLKNKEIESVSIENSVVELDTTENLEENINSDSVKKPKDLEKNKNSEKDNSSQVLETVNKPEEMETSQNTLEENKSKMLPRIENSKEETSKNLSEENISENPEEILSNTEVPEEEAEKNVSEVLQIVEHSEEVMETTKNIEEIDQSVRNIYHTFANVTKIDGDETTTNLTVEISEEIMETSKNSEEIDKPIRNIYHTFANITNVEVNETTINQTVENSEDIMETTKNSEEIDKPVRNIYHTFANITNVEADGTTTIEINTEQTVPVTEVNLFESKIEYGNKTIQSHNSEENTTNISVKEETQQEESQLDESNQVESARQIYETFSYTIQNSESDNLEVSIVDDASIEGFDLFEGGLGYNETVQTEETEAKNTADNTSKIDLEEDTKAEETELVVQKHEDSLKQTKKSPNVEETKLDVEKRESTPEQPKKHDKEKEEQKVRTTPSRRTRKRSESVELQSANANAKDNEDAPQPAKRLLRSRTVSTDSKDKEPATQSTSKSNTPTRSGRTRRLKSKETESNEDTPKKFKPSLEDIPQRRVLRSRTISTEEQQPENVASPTPKLRARTRSTDDTNSIDKEVKPRTRRAASAQPELPRIGEEDGVEKYSSSRRLTRRQVNLLKKINPTSSKNVELLEPVVMLEKHSFDSDTSHSASSTSSIRRSARNLRSSSQTSEQSSDQGSTKSVKKRGAKK